jgi:SWI/SNF-related matrix-associated actin-dependent regulator of chromatin subfamily A-like protein 1
LKPIHLKGAKWVLPIPIEPVTLKKLIDLPGTHIAQESQRVEGMIDGVAAAAARLGFPLPPGTKELLDEAPLKNVLGRGLRDYQERGVSALRRITKDVGGAILADDMGLGKTRQAIEFVQSFPPPTRALIVCPGSVRETWREELRKWATGTVAVLNPATTKADKKDWEDSAEAVWVITSYELADRAHDAAFNQSPPDVLIMDEGHMLCGRKSQRTARLQELSMLVPYKLMLTGTPMWSRPRDFYSVLRILFGQRFGSRSDFDLTYCGGYVNEWGGWVNKGATRAEELKRRISYYMVRREREEVLKELPALTRQIMWVDPPVRAAQAFQSAMLNRSSDNLWAAMKATLDAKIPPVLEYAAQSKRFLLFTWMKTHAHQIAKVLHSEMDTPCVCITGDMDVRERAALVKQAQANKWGVVATIDSAGAGVDGLQHVAHVGIMHAFDYVPLKMLQAEARLHRMGQTNGVHWTYFACKDSMDQLIVQTVVEKLDQWKSLMDKGGGRKNTLRDSLGVGQYGGDEKAALKALYEAMI